MFHSDALTSILKLPRNVSKILDITSVDTITCKYFKFTEVNDNVLSINTTSRDPARYAGSSFFLNIFFQKLIPTHMYVYMCVC